MMSCCKRRFKKIAYAIFANEKCVDAGKDASDQAIALLPPEQFIRFQARPEITAKFHFTMLIVFHRPRHIRSNHGIVFQYNDPWFISPDRLPYMEVIKINIDRKQVWLSGHAGFRK